MNTQQKIQTSRSPWHITGVCAGSYIIATAIKETPAISQSYELSVHHQQMPSNLLFQALSVYSYRKAYLNWRFQYNSTGQWTQWWKLGERNVNINAPKRSEDKPFFEFIQRLCRWMCFLMLTTDDNPKKNTL